VQRQHKRLYVGGLPADMTEGALRDLLERVLAQHGILGHDGPHVTAISLHLDKFFAFVEFRTPEDATRALNLDGLPLPLSLGGTKLRLRRPKDFSPLPGLDPSPPRVRLAGIVPTDVEDGPQKLFLGNIAPEVPETAVEELLTAVGDLKTFSLVRDPLNNASKGYGFAEYLDPLVTDRACAALHGTEVAGKKIVVQRASLGARTKDAAPDADSAPGPQLPDADPAAGAGVAAAPQNVTLDMVLHPSATALRDTLAPQPHPTPAVAFYNLLSAREAGDAALVAGLREGLGRVCKPTRLQVPQSEHQDTSTADLYRVVPVVAEYASAEEAQRAVMDVLGRRFLGHVPIAVYIPEGELSTFLVR
jgi:splicing factor U2AF subunit